MDANQIKYELNVNPQDFGRRIWRKQTRTVHKSGFSAVVGGNDNHYLFKLVFIIIFSLVEISIFNLRIQRGVAINNSCYKYQRIIFSTLQLSVSSQLRLPTRRGYNVIFAE